MFNKMSKRIIALLLVITMLSTGALPVFAEKSTACANGHTSTYAEEEPAFCGQEGYTEGYYCSVCGITLEGREIIPALEHDIVQVDAKNPTYTSVGWQAYEECTRCAYSTYVEIPALESATVADFDTFIMNLAILEEVANEYAMMNPGKDPIALVIKYIRTGVEKYNSGSWGIMAGYEDEDFAKTVAELEDAWNAEYTDPNDMLSISSLKNLEYFYLPNGDYADMGHVFGTLDIAYTNINSQNHADVGGWAGDLVDLLVYVDSKGVPEGATFEETVAYISEKCLGVDEEGVSGFGTQDIQGDLDAICLFDQLTAKDYELGDILNVFLTYYTAEDLCDESRATYFLNNRLNGVSIRSDVRDAVYNAYTGNKMIATLEDTEDLTCANIDDLRKACCYSFADYICKLSGDYVESVENPYLTPFNAETSILAPGVTQTIKQATSADGKQMVYYLATADITREDVNIYANYKNNDPSTWGMQTVLAQANAAQEKYGNPESEHYIENYNVIASTNGTGFNMSTGEPAGLLVMNGKEYHGINGDGFFGILKDGTAVIGTTKEYNTIYKDQVAEGIAGFGSTLVVDGEICLSATSMSTTDRASRTAVGITRTGKVVLMVLDGRQEPISCGGSLVEIAQIMLDAGCVQAVNLDGGGSSTYVSKAEGADELAVVNNPSDGIQRSVATSLMIVSTAPSSTAFDHAVLDSNYDYLTIGASTQVTASGVSATGNAADLPAGVTFALSNNAMGTITQDGIFTASKNGSVEVYLMLGDEVLASTTLEVISPDNIYFTTTNINAVYGQTVTLPVKLAYLGKDVAFTPNDVKCTLNKENAGTVTGLDFVATEGSGVKVVVINATLANGYASANITANLYNQGEATFDFNQATGGDRTFAWYREISNTTTDDNSVYEIVDVNEDMVTSYAFAIDMTQIPIPQQLNDLTYMLPGAEEGDVSAWRFLCQLAERVSVLSTVSPVIKFNDNVNVDYSNLTLVNDYFELTATEFDEDTNTLKLTLNWIDQTKAIDISSANPLCIVSGIKVTPKDDANWGAKNRITFAAEGEVGYKIYLRANALYSFSQKEDNQLVYGLYPFVNPNDANEKGGYFGSTYAEFNDSYTLVNTLKDGWASEEGGFAYYVNGIKQTGICLVDGYYYNFGDNGINVGRTKYTGLFYDQTDCVYRYAKIGELATGWNMIGGDWYYFDTTTKAAVTGTFEYTDEITYQMDITGKLIEGFWAKTLHGTKYYYGPGHYKTGWEVIDGKDYFFENTYRLESSCQLIIENTQRNWYYFDENGVCDKSYQIPDGFYTDRNGYGYCKNGESLQGVTQIDGDYYCFDWRGYAMTGYTSGRLFGDDYKAYTGFVEKDGTTYYYVNGKIATCGLYQIDGDYYYSYWDGTLKADGRYYIEKSFCDLPAGRNYSFGADGKMLDGIVNIDGTLYLYKNGSTATYGLYQIDGNYYYVYWGGVIKTNGRYYVSATNCDLPANKNYTFGADGKMLDGVVEIDGKLYLYQNGSTASYGLYELDGNYYYVYWDSTLKTTGRYYIEKSYCDLPANRNYSFDTNGKLLNGIVEENGKLYYYINGSTAPYGLYQIDGDYYLVYWDSTIKTSGKYYVEKSYCDLPVNKNYTFGADGKMLNGVVEIDGKLYLYKNGTTVSYGLHEYNGDYYYTYWDSALKTNGKYYIEKTHCDLAANTNYTFGADGKMLNGIVDVDGVTYYYINGKTASYGLYQIDGDYYFVDWDSTIKKDGKYYVEKSNCDLVANKEYTFDANGKMLDGIVEIDGVRYLYQDGALTPCGLYKIDGDYYYIYWDGSFKADGKYYIENTYCDLPAGKNYIFDTDGKMLDGIVEIDGELYYYENGNTSVHGLIEIDGYYYCVKWGGKLVVNQTYYVSETNGYTIRMHYTFDEYGRIIL